MKARGPGWSSELPVTRFQLRLEMAIAVSSAGPIDAVFVA